MQFLPASDALPALLHARYEGILVCHHGVQNTEAIKAIRATRSNRSAVIIALVKHEDARRAAAQAGATLVVANPSREALACTLRAAYGMFVRQRLRSVRVPIAASMIIQLTSGPSRIVSIVDVSETGACLQLQQQLRKGMTFGFAFRLSPAEPRVEGQAVVVWSKPSGLTGVEFVMMAGTSADSLRDWLRARLGGQEVVGFFRELAKSAQSVSP